MERVNIIVTSDDDYIQHLGVMLTSLLENTKYQKFIDIYFLDHGIEKVNKDALLSIVEDKYQLNLYFIELNKEIFKDFYISQHINQVTYYRIIAPNILPSHLKKVIYLDSDMVFVDDIKDLNDISLETYTIGAVIDPQGYERFEELNIKSKKYFNAGMLVIDLEQWKRRKYTEKLIEYINSNMELLKYWDQDALNAVLQNDWVQIHPKWNILTSYYEMNLVGSEYDEAFKNPGIIHYTTFKKPWKILCDHPLKDLYNKYLRKTEWKDYSVIPKEVIDFILNSDDVYIFGASKFGQLFYEGLCNNQKTIRGYLDNDKNKWGTFLQGVEVFAPEVLKTLNTQHSKVIICSMYADEISLQLRNLGLTEGNFLVISYL